MSIFLVLGSTAFVAGLLLRANNRPTPLSGSLFRFYLGMFVAGLGGMAITAGFVGIVVLLAFSYQATTQQTPDSRDS